MKTALRIIVHAVWAASLLTSGTLILAGLYCVVTQDRALGVYSSGAVTLAGMVWFACEIARPPSSFIK